MWFGAKRRQAQRIARSMSLARRSGRGVYQREWTVAPGADPLALDSMIESIIDWCRETLGLVRRPWGIDGFDLAVAVAGDDGAPRSLSLRQLRPIDLYQEQTVARLRELFATHDALQMPGVRRIAVAMFSWGDAAHEALG